MLRYSGFTGRRQRVVADEPDTRAQAARMHSDDSRRTHYAGSGNIGKSGEDEESGIPKTKEREKRATEGVMVVFNTRESINMTTRRRVRG